MADQAKEDHEPGGESSYRSVRRQVCRELLKEVEDSIEIIKPSFAASSTVFEKGRLRALEMVSDWINSIAEVDDDMPQEDPHPDREDRQDLKKMVVLAKKSAYQKARKRFVLEKMASSDDVYRHRNFGGRSILFLEGREDAYHFACNWLDEQIERCDDELGCQANSNEVQEPKGEEA